MCLICYLIWDLGNRENFEMMTLDVGTCVAIEKSIMAFVSDFVDLPDMKPMYPTREQKKSMLWLRASASPHPERCATKCCAWEYHNFSGSMA